MGWFPCTFKRANSVLLTAALGLWAVSVQATKIEFSVPTAEVEVPDQQKELKQEAKTAAKAELNFKGGLNFAPTVAPIVVSTAPERDPFAPDRDKDKTRNGRPSESVTDKNDPKLVAQKYKAAQESDAMRTTAQDSLSGSSWEVNRRSSVGRDTASRETDSIYNSRERSVGWSTLFREAQDERDRREQMSRLKDFKALYESHNSMMPIGTPSANSDPMKDSLWREQAMNQRGDSRDQLYSRRDDPAFAQPSAGFRGSALEMGNNAGPAKNDFRNSEIAPIRDFEQHRGVLEFPKRPGDLLK